MVGNFQIEATDRTTRARAGKLQTAHGVIETPVFMPVGTQGTVKCMAPGELRQLPAQIILGNTYHLMIRPGLELIQKAGGLHKFMNWAGPILTDSGGFQVFSLAKLRKISERGVEFQSHVDGQTLFLGPVEAMEAQTILGSDIAMAFDECAPWPCDREYACRSVDLTIQWAARCREKGLGSRQLLFGIVQGSLFADLRERCAKELVALDFPGYAIGGVSVGEPEPEMLQQVDAAVPHLPAEKPRYVMGVGTLPQLVQMVARGIDMFDCVLPTRAARHGKVFTNTGSFSIRAAACREDFGPLEAGCECYACREFSRAYLRHLIWANEILGLRLLTWHNLHVFLNLLRRARQAIGAGEFGEFQREFIAQYTEKADYDERI
ncbi:MAG: Queuine tRNA-ribosyltransferase [Verrucomicrobiae bacterium]|nr:Queuine tRNA-ribosyltransferase [Verrucomicrobiae bacterium]